MIDILIAVKMSSDRSNDDNSTTVKHLTGHDFENDPWEMLDSKAQLARDESVHLR